MFPSPDQHRRQIDTLPTYLSAGDWAPLTNAAAVFAAVANLPEDAACRVRALRVGHPSVLAWDPAPVVAWGTPGSNQARPDVPGPAWPIYSRDMAVARSCLKFLVALASGAPTPSLAPPKGPSGLFEALRLAVTPKAEAGAVDPHGVLVGATVATVWVQRYATELVDGEPQHYPPQPVHVDCTVPLKDLLAAPNGRIVVPADMPDLLDCIISRLTKLRMRGRPAGSQTARADHKAHAEAAEAEVRRLKQEMDSMARLYAEQLQQLSQPGVPVDNAAQYLVTMFDYLQPGAPFTELALLINQQDPALFRAIAQRLKARG
jgi:hypothetical protein